jgi:hypothetical protein
MQLSFRLNEVNLNNFSPYIHETRGFPIQKTLHILQFQSQMDVTVRYYNCVLLPYLNYFELEAGNRDSKRFFKDVNYMTNSLNMGEIKLLKGTVS